MASKESTSECKKSKRHRDEKEDNRSTKRRSETDKSETVAVHSANSWEKVDLGDDGRKNKFLRLMGASKKEHHGRFIIGENRTEHGRSQEEVEQLTERLEEQYEQGMGLVLSGAARQHKGLGFQGTSDEEPYKKRDEDPVPEEPALIPAETTEEEEEERPKKKKSKKHKDSCEKDEEVKSEDKQKSKPLLGFVKAGSG